MILAIMDFLIYLYYYQFIILYININKIYILPSTDMISLSDPISIFLFLNCDGGIGAVRKSSNAMIINKINYIIYFIRIYI